MPLVAALAVSLGAWNLVLSLTSAPEWAYLPTKLVPLAVILLVARVRRLGWREMGFGPEGIAPGLRWGGAVAAVVVVGLAVAFVLPPAERFLDDGRVAGTSVAMLLYHVLVRIPFGTAFVEEAVFRGVLLAAWARLAGLRAAVIGSSAVFGIWHIGPTLSLLDANDLAGGPLAVIAGVTASVVVTAVAGLGFCWLRLRTRGLVGPVAVHTAFNSLGLTAAFLHQEVL